MEEQEIEENRVCDILLQGMTVGEVTPSHIEEGELISFRGCERYCFDAIELTSDINLQKVTPLTKLKGNILPLYSEEDICVFQTEQQWKGSACYLHTSLVQKATR